MKKIAAFLAAVIVGALVGPTPAIQAQSRPWIEPVQARKGSWDFGVPTSFQPLHTGIDYIIPTGTSLKAVADGVVFWAEWWPKNSSPVGHGETLWIRHGWGNDGRPIFSVYAHLSEYKVGVGDYVQQGQVVAISGNTGAGTGPHLHFAVGRKSPSEKNWTFSDWDNPNLYFGESQAREGIQSEPAEKAGFDWRKTVGISALLGAALVLVGKFGPAIGGAIITAGLTALWAINLSLEMVGRLQMLLEPSPQEKARQRWKRSRFRPWRAGCWLGIQLALFPYLLALFTMSFTLIVGELPTGTSLEDLVGGHQALGQLLSRVSSIDPQEKAWGAIPAVQQRRAEKEVLAASALPTFKIRYWTGDWVTFQAPEEIWQEVRTAAKKHGCNPLLVVAVAHSESPVYDNISMSSASCLGVWQFFPATWERYKPYPGASRQEVSAAADAACRMIQDLGLAEEVNEISFARNFNGDDGSACWNCGRTLSSPESPSVQQAKYVFRLWQRLRAEVPVASAGNGG